MTNEEYLLFLFKGKKITKVPADTPKVLTGKQWYRKTRDDETEKVTR